MFKTDKGRVYQALEMHVFNESFKYDQNLDKTLSIYKMYVEMTDKFTDKRFSTNRWFLTINTAFITSISFLFTKDISNSITFFISLAGLSLSVVWLLSVISYSKFNEGRYYIINRTEKELPIKPFYAENELLYGDNKAIEYVSLTLLERFVPVTFGALYIIFMAHSYWSILPIICIHIAL